MKFEIELPVSTLRLALTGLGKVIGRTTLPVLRCVRLDRTDAGQVTLQATDLDSTATYRLPGEFAGQPGALLIPWEHFSKVVKTNREKVGFSLEGKATVVIRSFLSSIAFEEPIAVPLLDEWPFLPKTDEQVIASGESFKLAVRQAMQCASTDETRYVLNGVCLDPSADGHYVIGTDGRHLYSANSFNFPLKESLILPTRKFLLWSGFLEDGDWTLHLRTSDKNCGWAELRSVHWTFQTKWIEGSYPNWRQVVPNSDVGMTRVRFGAEAVQLLLDALPHLPASERSTSVTLHADANGFRVASRASDTAPWAEPTVKGAQVDGPGQMVVVNRDYLIKAFRMEFTELELRPPTDENTHNPLVFRSPGKVMLIMPMRPGDPIAASASTPSEPPQEKSTEAVPSEPREATTTETERKNTLMTAPVTAPERGHIKAVLAEGEETPFKAAMNNLEKLRTGLKDLQSELIQTVSLLKAAERDQRATEKEIESVRSTLRSLKKVEI